MWRAASISLLILPVAVGCERSETRAVDKTGTLITRGIARDWDQDGRAIWFELSSMDMRFVLSGSGYDPDAVYEAVSDSNENSLSMTVRFDREPVGIDSQDSQVPAYVVREIRYDGRVLPGVAGASSRWGRTPSPSEAALARGVAAYNAEKYADAKTELSRTIELGGLEPELETLAYKTRGNALADEIMNTRTQPDDEGDQQLVRALADMQKWASLDPKDSAAMFDIAAVQRSLGAYEEAFDSYAAIARKWPDRYYRTAVSVGAVHRLMGRHDEALRALDEMAAAHGPQSGMMFHYHRGWTLTELNRYEDAVKEFTIGLEDQSDYNWAFIKRSCALAQLGRVPEALKDAEQALRLQKEVDPELFAGKAGQEVNARTEAIVFELRNAVAGARNQPTSVPCDGYPDYGGDWPRTRSRWLP